MDTNTTFALKHLFLHLRDKSFVNAHLQRLLEILKSNSFTDPHFGVGPFERKVFNDSKDAYRATTCTYFFRSAEIRSLHLKLVVAVFCSVSPSVIMIKYVCILMGGSDFSQQVRGVQPGAFEDAIRQLSTTVEHHRIRTIFSSLQPIISQLDG